MCIAMIQEPKGKCCTNDSNKALQQGKKIRHLKKGVEVVEFLKKAFTVFFAFGRVSTRYAGSNQKTNASNVCIRFQRDVRTRVDSSLALCE